MQSRVGAMLPERKLLKIEDAEPECTEDCKGSELSKVAKSRRSGGRSSFIIPYTRSGLPDRARLCNSNGLPRWMESGTGMDGSGLEKPYAEALKSGQARLCGSRELPMVTKSSKGMAKSSRHML